MYPGVSGQNPDPKDVKETIMDISYNKDAGNVALYLRYRDLGDYWDFVAPITKKGT